MVQPMISQRELLTTPTEARGIFLRFETWYTWHHDMKLKILTPSKIGATLAPGDKLQLKLGSLTLRPIIIENNPGSFIWQGSFLGLLTGKHIFQFLPSETEGKCLLIQREEASGPLSFVYREGWPSWLGGQRKKTEEMFERFNHDLWKRVIAGGSMMASEGKDWDEHFESFRGSFMM